MKMSRFTYRYTSKKAKRMPTAIWLMAGLLFFLITPTWAFDLDHGEAGVLFSGLENPKNVTLIMDKSVADDWIVTGKKGGGDDDDDFGEGTCTIIPWFCGDD